MKIMQIITGFHDGGAEKFIIDLSNELSKNNEVIICSLYDIEKDMFLADGLKQRVKIITLNKKAGFDGKLFFKIYKLIKNENPDAVNTHLRAFFYSSLAIMFSKTNFFHTVHNMADKETSPIFRKIYKIFFKYFGVVPIAISKEVLNSIQYEYSDNFNILIENGVKAINPSINISSVNQEIEQYKKTDETKVFLTIGRIGEQKNYSLLVNTVNKLVLENHDIVLLIIGADHGELENLKSIACDRIYFLGVKKNVIDYMYYADAFCLSSLYEGLPIVLLEALSMGCVPICTPAGGVVDVVDNNIGFLSNGFSNLDYYAVMKDFLYSSSSELEKMKKNCKDLFASKYSIEITAKEYYDLYQKELNKKKVEFDA